MTVAGDSVEYVSGGVRVRIDGLNAVVRKLNKAGADAGEMRDLMHQVGSIVIGGAHAPVLSGTLSGTLRAGRGKTKAVVRAGGARAPYAGVVHYGWPARNIHPQPYLTDALAARHAQIFTALEAGINDLLRRNNLT